MATTETMAPAARNRVAAVVLGAIGVGLVVALVLALRPQPQLAADEDVFKTVDALYTAVRMRDEPRVTTCEQRLAAYRDAGKLPADAAAVLDAVIAKARGGGWDAAAERLYVFMTGQRRDGPAEPPAPKRDAKAKPAQRK